MTDITAPRPPSYPAIIPPFVCPADEDYDTAYTRYRDVNDIRVTLSPDSASSLFEVEARLLALIRFRFECDGLLPRPRVTRLDEINKRYWRAAKRFNTSPVLIALTLVDHGLIKLAHTYKGAKVFYPPDQMKRYLTVHGGSEPGKLVEALINA